ncbi:carboxylesterase/lipase family protein [Actinoplanes sp. NPDC049681]|uniref:carboxylesterase/lipase family protein n=1 Tax=Actinoplanes sp. NPDC049681 TaxID=3363905 RepID=UPI0037B6CA7F
MRRTAVCTVLIALAGLGAAPAAGNGSAAVVRTDAGPVRGTVTAGHRSFQGVPYAAAPTGDLRWRAPQPVRPWHAVRDATAPGQACAQNSPAGGPSGGEDCLYLDVTTPVGRRGPVPVLVWLHGGSFQSGAGSMYDPRRLAERGGVMVVTPNYRLGVFGFFGLPGLPGSGTFGLQDQQAALRWVRRNAAAFGGDPGRVTLAGQSAGGLSVCAHLTSPAAAGLFDRAIIESGPCLTDWPSGLFFPGIPAGSPWSTVGEVAGEGARLAAEPAIGCPAGASRVACLRATAPDKLLSATRGTGPHAFLTPAYGTALLPELPARALRAGAFHRVPVLSGANRDEHRGLIGVLEASAPVTGSNYRAALATAFGDQARRVERAYPQRAYGSPGLAWAAVATDRIWACPTAAGNRLLARQNPTFAYEFGERHGPAPDATYGWGAYHGAELPFLFDVGWLTGEPQHGLADRMIAAWSGFAATGDPGWPRVRPAAPVPYAEVLASGAGGPVDVEARHRCGFWASVPAAAH